MTQNDTPQEWRLASNQASVWLPTVVPLLMLVIGLGLLAAAALGKVQTDEFHFYFLVVWLCGVLWVNYKALRMPRRIVMGSGGLISFRSVIGETSMRAQDVVSITPMRGRLGYMQLEYTGGSLQFIGQFDGFHTFLNRLTELNPAVVLHGC